MGAFLADAPEVISIPVIVLQKARSPKSQKLRLSIFLCLSVFMAILALVRTCKFGKGSGIHLVWQVFWQYIEACIACFMASVSTFRSLLAPNSSRVKRNQARGPSTNTRQQIWRKFKDPKRKTPLLDSDACCNEFPQIPMATLSGVGTLIRGTHLASRTPSVMSSEVEYSGENWPLRMPNSDEIYVKGRVDTYEESVSPMSSQTGTFDDVSKNYTTITSPCAKSI